MSEALRRLAIVIVLLGLFALGVAAIGCKKCLGER